MAASGGISHNPNLGSDVTGNWQKLGENVGEGPDVDTLFKAFVNSPHHYANLVDPAFSLIGIGVVVAADGTMYTTHDFEQPANSPAPAPPPPPPAASPPAPVRTASSAPAVSASPAAPSATPAPPTGPTASRAGASSASPAAPPAPDSSHRVIVVLDELHSLDGSGN
jgi:hypothetical protein